ncbi:transcription cofactor vestigial-like protein 4 isoform X2 [Agrilus planipennis]|uniref:Transcription cofactor vestigial-like protein 4 isoform X2 n=1 Tax=Agrilus planipennis TaxID=224129 RepID=A0A7F5R7Y8_AGRPL|nr:transcription cofactor vestigial-like protein 4 isoform X2 [Agrilus planipennis]
METPLDVLSRAATMLQETLNQPTIADDLKSQSTSKQLPTSKWKRDRRTRAEYTRKSDPKLPESFIQNLEQSGSEKQDQNNSSTVTNTSSTNGCGTSDTPIDMSIRQKGQPPSYDQTISNPNFRSNYRASVIMHNGSQGKDDIPSGMSMCDPIIDEHFRRSLGKDYIKIFSNGETSKEDKPVKKTTIVKNQDSIVELMDNSGLTVDDHFAKALGDTWLKLNKKDSNATDKGTVLSV